MHIFAVGWPLAGMTKNKQKSIVKALDGNFLQSEYKLLKNCFYNFKVQTKTYPETGSKLNLNTSTRMCKFRKWAENGLLRVSAEIL